MAMLGESFQNLSHYDFYCNVCERIKPSYATSIHDKDEVCDCRERLRRSTAAQDIIQRLVKAGDSLAFYYSSGHGQGS